MILTLQRELAPLSGYPGRWAVAGGWAIDLFLGYQTRPHEDVDLSVIRSDQSILRAFLHGVDARIAHDGTLRPWLPDEELGAALHEIHATWPSGETLELLVDETDDAGTAWVYRRDARVRLPLADVVMTREGIPYLSPEVVLLYKSKGTRAKDDADLAAVLPLIRPERRRWLADAIALADGSHRWVNVLRRQAM